MPNIGYATLVIIPTARGISATVQRQITKPVADAGTTAGNRAGTNIRSGIAKTDYSRAGGAMVTPFARAGRTAGARAGTAITRGIEHQDYEQSGRKAADRFGRGFRSGIAAIGTGFNIASTAARLFVANAGTIASGFGLAAKLVRGFSAATFISAIALRQVAAVGLTKLAGVLRIIAAIASRVAREIGQVTSAFLLLQGVVRVVGFLTNFGKKMAMLTVGTAAAIGVVSGLSTMIGGALVSALSAGLVALGGFAGAAAGLGGPMFFALKVGFKGLSDGAAEFNKQFGDADEAMNKMVGQRMGPMLTAFRTMRVEMVDRFSAEMTPAFQRIGVGVDVVRGKFGWMAVYAGQLGQGIGKAIAGPANLEAFQRIGDASGKFFQHLNTDEMGLSAVASGLIQFSATAAETFADSSRSANEFFFNIGNKLANITPEQIRGALAQFKQVFTNIGNVAMPLVSLVRQMGAISAAALAPGFAAVGQGVRDATPGLVNMAQIIMPALGEVMQRLAPILPKLVEAFTPWATTLATVAPPLATVVTHLAPLAPYLLMAATGFKVAGAVMLLWNAASFAGAVAQGVFAAAMGRSAMTLTGNTIALAAHRAALIAGAVAARLFGIAMAFATGPIGIAIAAVAAIGVALWAFFTKTEVGKRLWEKIWTGIKAAVAVTWEWLQGAWEAIKNAALVVWQYLQVAWDGISSAVGVAWKYMQVAWDAILVGFGWIGEKAMWLWNSAIQPAFAFIGGLISAWWTGIVQPAFDGVKAAFTAVGNVIGWWWNSIVTPAFNAVSTIISYWWENVGRPIFHNFQTAIGMIGDAVSNWWTGKVQPTFNAAGDVISWWWNSIVGPAFDLAKAGIGLLGDAISWWWTSIVTPAFDAAGAVISWWWNSIVGPAFDLAKAGVTLLGDGFTWFRDTVITPVFDTVGSVIQGTWDKVVSPVFDKVKSGVEIVGEAFGKAGETVKSAWSGMADILRPAIHALGGLLVKVPLKIGPWEIPGAGIAQDLGNAMQAFATGGVVGDRAGRTPAGLLWGPGTPTSDSILGVDTSGIPTALVSTDEGIVTAAAMARGGAELVAALNRGWSPTPEQLHGWLPGFAEGGQVGGKVSKSQWLNKVRGIEGAEYDYGGWGNGWKTDCSGAQARAANLIAYGNTEDGGRFDTAGMGAALDRRGARPGLGGNDDYSVGWVVGGPGGGHAAGTAPGGWGFEMGGARGNGQWSGSAALANDPQFDQHRHFPGSMFTGAGGNSAGTSAATSPPEDTTDSSTPTSDTTTGTGGGEQKTRLKSFEELGRDFGGIFAKGLLETFGLEDSVLADPSKLVTGDTGDNVRVPLQTQQTNPAAPAAQSPAPSASTGVGDTGDATTAAPVDPRTSLKGSALYAYDLSKVAADMGMGERAAVIGTAAGLVETGLKMYANSSVPESLSFPHDAVGSDHDSVGVLQQRASWGSVADRMNSPVSAKLFYNALRGISGWEQMDPGAAAQAVQRSAFPDRYGAKITDARRWVKDAKVFDTGGFLAPGGIAVSALTKTEPLLPAERWAVAEANIDAVDRMVATLTAPGRGRGRDAARGGDTYIAYGYTADQIADEWQRRQWARTGGYDGRGW